VAVTGAAGFLGAALTRRLVSDLRPAVVRGVTRRPPRHPTEGVTYANRLTAGQVAELDILFHLAGSSGIAESLSDPIGDLRSNAELTIAYLEAIRSTGSRCTVVLASSCAVYGAVEGTVSEAQPPAPQTPYGASKLAAETYASAYGRLYSVDTRIARIANPYGPGQRKLVVYDLAARALHEGRPLRVRGGGTEVRDFIHADDVAQALIAISLAEERGGIYNVGSGKPVALREIAFLVAEAAGLTVEDVVFEGSHELGKVEWFSPQVRRLMDLGFRPRHGLREGIEEVVRWMRRGT